MINQRRKIPSHIIFSQIQGKPKLPSIETPRYRQAFDHSEMGDMVDSFQKIWSQMVIFPCQWWFCSTNNDPKTHIHEDPTSFFESRIRITWVTLFSSDFLGTPVPSKPLASKRTGTGSVRLLQGVKGWNTNSWEGNSSRWFQGWDLI